MRVAFHGSLLADETRESSIKPSSHLMNHHTNDRSLWPRRIAGALVCLVFGSAFGLHGVQGAQGAHRAHLSTDLLVHEGRHTAARKHVILRGTPDEIQAIAER